MQTTIQNRVRKIFFIGSFFYLVSANAQAPDKISYQGIIRNASNALVANTGVGVRISMLQGTATGTEVYKELFNPNPVTNTNGLVSLTIGTGLPITGTLAGVDWSAGPYFIKTETDPTGGTNYTVTATTQLLSVPFALNSKTSEKTKAINGDAGYVPVFNATGEELVNSTIFQTDSGKIGIGTNTVSTMFRAQINGIGVYSDTAPYLGTLLVTNPDTNSTTSGIYSEGAWKGVVGHNKGTVSRVRAIGVEGLVDNDSANIDSAIGVSGVATCTFSPKNIGIYGYASGATTNFAGYFDGNLAVTGASRLGNFGDYINRINFSNVIIGSSATQKKVFHYDYNNYSSNLPLNVNVTLQQQAAFSDVFSVSTTNFNSSGFDIVIYRIDGPGWAQNLQASVTIIK